MRVLPLKSSPVKGSGYALQISDYCCSRHINTSTRRCCWLLSLATVGTPSCLSFSAEINRWYNLQGFWAKWFVSVSIHMNVSIQGFPAKHFTVLKWTRSYFQLSGFNVVADWVCVPSLPQLFSPLSVQCDTLLVQTHHSLTWLTLTCMVRCQQTGGWDHQMRFQRL